MWCEAKRDARYARTSSWATNKSPGSQVLLLGKGVPEAGTIFEGNYYMYYVRAAN